MQVADGIHRLTPGVCNFYDHSDHTGFAERARTTAAAPVWIHQADAAAEARTGLPVAWRALSAQRGGWS